MLYLRLLHKADHEETENYAIIGLGIIPLTAKMAYAHGASAGIPAGSQLNWLLLIIPFVGIFGYWIFVLPKK